MIEKADGTLYFSSEAECGFSLDDLANFWQQSRRCSRLGDVSGAEEHLEHYDSLREQLVNTIMTNQKDKDE